MKRRITCLVALATILAACAGDAEPTDTATTTSTPPSLTASTTTTATVQTTTLPTPPTTVATSTTTNVAGDTDSQDTTPPDLTVTNPTDGATVTSATYQFRGTTEPGATVMAAGRYGADVAADGTWSIVLLLNPGNNTTTITATDQAGNTTEVRVSVRYEKPLTIGHAAEIAQARLDTLWTADPTNEIGAIEIRCDDPERPIDAGDVFTCDGIGRVPATLEIGTLAFLVLDHQGTTSMLSGSDLPDLEAAYAGTPHGLLCRDLLTDKASWPFNVAGTTNETAAFLATAYWFLEGRPDRMDADRNGIPCETVFPEDAIAWVWNGGLLTGTHESEEPSVPESLHRVDDLPPVPVGSRLVDFTLFSGGPTVLVDTPDGWQVWRGPGGDASWQVEVLPDGMFGEAGLHTVAALGDETYVAGHASHLVPAVWRRDAHGTWTEHRVDEQGGSWGEMTGIAECAGRAVFVGHSSASNQVLGFEVWGFDGDGGLEPVFRRGGGPPGSGTPPPAVYCHEGSFLALATYGRAPEAGGDFTYSNEIWTSPTGSDWTLVTADPIDPAIRPRDDLGVIRAGSTLWVVSDGDIASSTDGVHWMRIDRAAAGFESDDWIATMGGGALGLLVTGIDHLGDSLDPVMWWTPNGDTWQRLDDHPALDPLGVEVVVGPTVLMIAPSSSFEAGAPIMWVYVAAG